MKFVFVPSNAQELAVLKAASKALHTIADLEDEELIKYALYELIKSYEESTGEKLVKEWQLPTY